MTITPAHSQIDFELAEKYDLEVTQIIDFEGKIRTEVSTEFGGLDISVARKKVLERLEEKGLLTEVDEKYVPEQSGKLSWQRIDRTTSNETMVYSM